MSPATTVLQPPPTGPRRALADLTDRIIGCALAVHRELGPGLVSSAYETCLALEMSATALSWKRHVAVPIRYRGMPIDCGFRLGLVVEGAVAVEVAAAGRLEAVDEARLVSRLRLAGLRAGLLIDFGVRLLPQGLIRRVA
jgi:GxxExxY protein